MTIQQLARANEIQKSLKYANERLAAICRAIEISVPEKVFAERNYHLSISRGT